MSTSFTKVFVTGAGGWLGRRLVQRLAAGEISSMYDKTQRDIYCHSFAKEDFQKIKEEFKNLKFYSGSLVDKSSSERFLSEANSESLLIHTAGVIHPRKVKDFYDINLKATESLVNDAVRRNVKKIIIISSNSPIGCNVNNSVNNFFDEESPFNPYMNYGKSKMQMELMLQSYIERGIDITILRPPWFYGKGMPQRQIQFYEMIIKGSFPFVGDGTNIRSIVNIDNIIECIFLAAMSSKSRGQTYWVSDDSNLSMKEIVTIISDVFKNEFNISTNENKIHLPNFIGSIAEWLDKFIQMTGNYHQKIHVLSEMNKNIACSNKKAKKELGYEPKISLYEGTMEAYRDYIKNNE